MINEDVRINCQSSIRIEKDNKIIYIDPYKIEKEMEDADFLFITHDHYDHFSKDDILKVINEDTVIVIPESCSSKIEVLLLNNKIIYVKPNNKYEINNLKFETVAAYNTDKLYHQNISEWVGYVIELSLKRYFITGDTDINLENKKVKCDYLFVPVGGEYTMDYKEAATLANLIKPKLAIPTHYATIVGSNIDAIKFQELLDNDIKCDILYKEDI